jgi:ribosome-binding protein aMBF1 (putative translation factor)
MECEVCDKPSKQRAKVFIKSDELYLCQKCILKLQRQRLKYCEERQGYRFNGNLRRNRLLDGRRLSKFKF